MNTFWPVLLITAGITYFLRGLPFLFFTKKQMPGWLDRLGKSLPSAVMACLIVYCLQDTRFDGTLSGISGLIAAGVTMITYWLSKSMFISMLTATAAYMFLVSGLI